MRLHGLQPGIPFSARFMRDEPFDPLDTPGDIALYAGGGTSSHITISSKDDLIHFVTNQGEGAIGRLSTTLGCLTPGTEIRIIRTLDEQPIQGVDPIPTAFKIVGVKLPDSEQKYCILVKEGRRAPLILPWISLRQSAKEIPMPNLDFSNVTVGPSDDSSVILNNLENAVALGSLKNRSNGRQEIFSSFIELDGFTLKYSLHERPSGNGQTIYEVDLEINDSNRCLLLDPDSLAQALERDPNIEQHLSPELVSLIPSLLDAAIRIQQTTVDAPRTKVTSTATTPEPTLLYKEFLELIGRMHVSTIYTCDSAAAIRRYLDHSGKSNIPIIEAFKFDPSTASKIHIGDENLAWHIKRLQGGIVSLNKLSKELRNPYVLWRALIKKDDAQRYQYSESRIAPKTIKTLEKFCDQIDLLNKLFLYNPESNLFGELPVSDNLRRGFIQREKELVVNFNQMGDGEPKPLFEEYYETDFDILVVAESLNLYDFHPDLRKYLPSVIGLSRFGLS